MRAKVIFFTKINIFLREQFWKLCLPNSLWRDTSWSQTERGWEGESVAHLPTRGCERVLSPPSLPRQLTVCVAKWEWNWTCTASSTSQAITILSVPPCRRYFGTTVVQLARRTCSSCPRVLGIRKCGQTPWAIHSHPRWVLGRVPKAEEASGGQGGLLRGGGGGQSTSWTSLCFAF